jgi:hypothetical protein
MLGVQELSIETKTAPIVGYNSPVAPLPSGSFFWLGKGLADAKAMPFF